MAVVALEQAARRLSMPRLFLSAIGALGGVLLAQLVASALIVFLPAAGSAAGRGFLSLLLAYMGVVFVLRREEELGGITRMVFPGAVSGDPRFKVLDTSVIIDGRIADVCQAGFLEGTLLVPQYVLRELQQIADSSDPLKRNRGRRGLDVLQRLQRLPGVRTRAARPRLPPDPGGRRAAHRDGRAVGGVIVTNDYNLNKVAELHGVRVLNINELAGALRPVVLPGEMLHVHVLARGRRPARASPTSTTARWSWSSRAAGTSARRSTSWSTRCSRPPPGA